MENPIKPRRRSRTQDEGPAPTTRTAPHPNDRRGSAPTTEALPPEASTADDERRTSGAAIRAFVEM